MPRAPTSIPSTYVSGRSFNAVDPFGLNGQCTENPGCNGGSTNVGGDPKGWGDALESAGKWIGGAASDVADGLSDAASAIGSLFGGGGGPSAPKIVRITQNIKSAQRVLTYPMLGVGQYFGEQISEIAANAMKPGASFTAGGFAIKAAGEAINQLGAITGPITGSLVTSSTALLPQATPGDVGPSAGRLVVQGAALFLGGKIGGAAGGTGGARAVGAAIEAAELSAAEGGLGSGRAYSVAFETTLEEAGAGTRAAHFKAANAALSESLSAETLQDLGVSVPKSNAGTILGESPQGMDLAPRAGSAGRDATGPASHASRFDVAASTPSWRRRRIRTLGSRLLKKRSDR